MLKPIHRFLVLAIAGWMNRQQQEAIAYLKVENQILREKLGQKRIRLNDSQKQRLAAAAAKLGRGLLAQLGTLFSPDTPWSSWFPCGSRTPQLSAHSTPYENPRRVCDCPKW